MMNETLSLIMTTDVISVAPNDTLKSVRELFLNSKLQRVAVKDKENLVGIVTMVDLWKLDKGSSEYNDMLVKDIMTTKMAKLEATERIGVAAELLLQNRFHAVPVVEGDKLVGLVTSFDVMLYNFKKAYPNQFDIPI